MLCEIDLLDQHKHGGHQVQLCTHFLSAWFFTGFATVGNGALGPHLSFGAPLSESIAGGNVGASQGPFGASCMCHLNQWL